jgi:cell division protein FtsA
MLKHLNQLVKFKTGMDVRIGFPGEKMAADSADEINQPMFSTSVGLLLKGLEYYEEKQEEMVIAEETGEDQEPQAEMEELKKAKKGLKKGRILENLKNTLSDIFDETDVKM